MIEKNKNLKKATAAGVAAAGTGSGTDTNDPARLQQAKQLSEETNKSENVLRPKTLKDYVGQDGIKRNLSVFLPAAKKRGEPMEHILLHGAPGLGKTTLAYILASEMTAQIRSTSGPAIEKPGDLAAILTNLKPGDVLFIDEIHRLRSNIEEILYSAMEDFCLDLVVGKGPSARSMRIGLPKFTLIGATTKLSSISSPLRDRFGNVLKLDFYTEADITKIIKRSAGILKVEIEDDAAVRLAQSARRTPRIANRLLRRTRDFAHVNDRNDVDLAITEETLQILGIDELGLDSTDRKILTIIAEKFHGGPVGLSTLSAATSEEEATIEDIYEPFLMQLGFLKRSPRGRLLTKNVYTHLGINQP